MPYHDHPTNSNYKLANQSANTFDGQCLDPCQVDHENDQNVILSLHVYHRCVKLVVKYIKIALNASTVTNF